MLLRGLKYFPWLVLLAGLEIILTLPVLAAAETNAVEAATGFFYQSWQTEEGLPNNDVHGVEQTADGFLWIGTRNGLVRFDGRKFISGFTPGLIGAAKVSVWRMSHTPDGKALVVLESGGVLTRQGEVFEALIVDGKPDQHRAYSLCSDAIGRIWTVSLEGEVTQLFAGTAKSLGIPVPGPVRTSTLVCDSESTVWLASGGTLGFFRNNKFQAVATNLAPALFITPARAGGVWMTTTRGLYRVEPGGTPREITPLPWPAGEVNVRDLLEDRAGAVWIGTSAKGLFRWFGGKFQSVPTSHNNILCLTEDHTGNLWVGTQGGGLDLIRPRQFKVLDSHRGLPNDRVFSFAEDRQNRIWIATQDRGLCCWSNGAVKVFGPTDGWPEINPLCLAADAEGGVWIGTQNEGLYYWRDGHFRNYTQALGMPIRFVNCLRVDSSGRVWAGSYLDGLYCLEREKLRLYTVNDGLPDKAVRDVAEDAAGNVWVGTADGGLAKLVNGRFQSFIREHSAGESIRAMLATDDGAIWLGTAGAGLVRFKNGRFENVTAAAGLPDDGMQSLLLDSAGWMWCGTSRGLFRVELHELNAYVEGKRTSVQTFSYGHSDGLSDFQFNGEFQPAALATRAGQFWFASVKGAVMFWPAGMKRNHEPPGVFIEAVRRNGEAQPMQNELKLAAGVRILEFKFCAPEFDAPERVRYRHKLDGENTDWSQPSAEAVAIYTNLSPGPHRFQVIACNSDGGGTEQGASLTLVVAPFFWQTWWFPPVAVAAGVALIALIVRWFALRRLQRRIAELEQEHALEKERGRIAKDIHDELGANLTSIGWLADLGRKHILQPEAVTAGLEKIAINARQSLSAMDAIVWALNPQNDSLEHFANYIAHFASEFFQPTAIRCRLDIPPDLPAHPMSTEARHHLFLAVKEALNNVARHSGASELWIRLQLSEAELRLSIRDNGRGLPLTGTQPGQDGLGNIRERLDALGGNLRVESTPDTGTELVFSVPLKNLNA
jgi:signal transduction histidine kinase/ligand-binding sensor domain-containing protein